MPVMLVVISASATTRAATDTVQNVKATNGKNGYRHERQIYCLFPTSTSYSLYLLSSTHWYFISLKQCTMHYLKATWQTLETFGMNKGLQIGMIAVLHTRGQNLSLHPHLHCIVPGGWGS